MGIIRRRQDKPYSWEGIEIGDEYGPVEGDVSDFLIKSHAYAVDDYSPWYFQDQTPFGARIGHPTLLCNSILNLFRISYRIVDPYPGGLHARNDIELLLPIYAGQRVTIRGGNVDKYQKRDQNYRVLEGEVLDVAGRTLLRMRALETVGLNVSTRVGQATSSTKSHAITGEIPVGAPVVTRASLEVVEDAVLPSICRHTTLEQSIAFSGAPYGWVEDGAKEITRGIHSDPEWARNRGLDDVAVQGLVSNAYLSQVCADFFGPLWLTTGRMSLAFVRPVIARDTLTTGAMVKRLIEEERTKRLELDVWCKNQRNELVTVGKASASVE